MTLKKKKKKKKPHHMREACVMRLVSFMHTKFIEIDQKKEWKRLKYGLKCALSLCPNP